MANVRSICRRAWHALRTPWAAGLLGVVLIADGYRQVDWNGFEPGPSLLARAAGWCQDQLGHGRGWMCRLPAFPTVVAFGELKDGSVMLVDEGMPKDSTPFAVTLDATFNRYGAWSDWLDRREFTFEFEPSMHQDTRESAVRAWWSFAQQYYGRDGGMARTDGAGVTVTRIDGWRLANEVVALSALALFARAGWYSAFHWRSDRRRARGGCSKCGYSREGLDAGAACPECGATGSRAGASLATGSLTSTTAVDFDSSPRRESELP